MLFVDDPEPNPNHRKVHSPLGAAPAGPGSKASASCAPRQCARNSVCAACACWALQACAALIGSAGPWGECSRECSRECCGEHSCEHSRNRANSCATRRRESSRRAAALAPGRFQRGRQQHAVARGQRVAAPLPSAARHANARQFPQKNGATPWGEGAARPGPRLGAAALAPARLGRRRRKNQSASAPCAGSAPSRLRACARRSSWQAQLRTSASSWRPRRRQPKRASWASWACWAGWACGGEAKLTRLAPVQSSSVSMRSIMNSACSALMLAKPAGRPSSVSTALPSSLSPMPSSAWLKLLTTSAGTRGCASKTW